MKDAKLREEVEARLGLLSTRLDALTRAVDGLAVRVHGVEIDGRRYLETSLRLGILLDHLGLDVVYEPSRTIVCPRASAKAGESAPAREE